MGYRRLSTVEGRSRWSLAPSTRSVLSTCDAISTVKYFVDSDLDQAKFSSLVFSYCFFYVVNVSEES